MSHDLLPTRELRARTPRARLAWMLIAALAAARLFGGAAPVQAQPLGPADAGATIFQITDTHVCAASSCNSQKNNLRTWVDYANAVSDLTGSLCSGDLVDWADSQADFDAYFNEVSRLTRPHTSAPGNHDYQSHTGKSYATLGYPRYGSQVIGDFMFVATDAQSGGLDFTAIENLLKQNLGRYRLGIVQHYPLYVPAGTPCGGSDCSLAQVNVDKFKDLAARYDVELFLVGHDHAFFYTRDKDNYFEQFAAADLGAANQYAMLYEDGARLAYGDNKNNGSPVFAPITPQRWDGLNLLGKILTAEPVRVKALGNITSAKFAINDKSYWFPMANQGNGFWSANYDWTQLTRDVSATLYIKLVSSPVEREQAYAIRVGSEYPNQPPAATDQTNAPPTGWNLGTVTLTCGASDDKADIARGEWFVDGARVKLQTVSWTSAATFRYDWNTAAAGYGEHLLRCKVSDRFGRVVRTDRRAVTLTPPPPGLSVSYSKPDVLLNWTTGASGLQSEVWRSDHPVGSGDPGARELIGETSGTSYTDDDAGLTEGLGCYQVRTRTANGVYSPLSNEVGKFSYGLKKG